MKAQELLDIIAVLREQLGNMISKMEMIEREVFTHKVAFNHKEAKRNYIHSERGKAKAREYSRRYYAKKKAKVGNNIVE